MTSELWRELYDQQAFKPAPSLWELAEAHVPFSELGARQAPEPRVRSGLEEGDGLALLVGAPGSGKSSVLAYVAARLAGSRSDAGRLYLPVFVPVAARPEASDLDLFGRGVALEVLLALREQLPKAARERLERQLAEQVSRQRTPPQFNARLAARIPGLSSEAGVKFAGEIVTLAGRERLDNYGGLRSLGDLARAHGHELIVLVEDTDAWSSIPSGPEVAEAFFAGVLRPLASDADVAVGVAVQPRWEELPAFAELKERAVAAVPMPPVPRPPRATRVVAAVLERRVRRAVGAEVAGEDVIERLLTPDGLETLASEMIERGSLRAPLARLRDTLDRFADGLPERLDREHFLETF
jgi:AAA ATPase-like protein